MYIPPPFLIKDEKKIISFIQQFPFATIVSNGEFAPVATHLPFLLEKDENQNLFLLSHIAAANQQCKDLQKSENEVLTIFQGPHAYISPQLYENKNSVPTWDYSSVHIYGKITFIEDKNENYEFLKRLITHFEPSFTTQFQNLPQQYIKVLMAEIKVFRIIVSKVEACFKLSQNKTLKDQQNIISYLRESKDFSAQALAEFMAANLEIK